MLVLSRKKNEQIIIGDGAFGTMLQAAGLAAGVMPEAWNSDHPDAVRTVHAQYVAAGADYIVPGSLMFREDPPAMRAWLATLG